MPTTPTLIFTSPSGAESTDRIVPGLSTDLLPQLPPPSSTNAPPLRSRPPTPATTGPPESMHAFSKGHKTWFPASTAPPKTSATESDPDDANHVMRGRTLRLNTLHQRVYHSQDSSPVLFPLDDPEATTAGMELAAASKDFLLPQTSPPILPSPSKSRFLNSSGSRASHLLSFLSGIPDSPQVWLALYFVLNLSLTLYNKSVLVHFPFPYTLTALHAFCGTIGTYVLLRLESRTQHGGFRKPLTSTPMPNLSGKELIVLLLFSILYTVNIIVSNASLRVVTVPFHQVVRASTPFFTIVFAAVLLGRRCSKDKLLSLIPVVAGVGFATYGDYYFTPFGFFLTLLGTLLAALKTTLTNVLLAKPSSTPSALPTPTTQGYFAFDPIAQRNGNATSLGLKSPHSSLPPKQKLFPSLLARVTNAISRTDSGSLPSPNNVPLLSPIISPSSVVTGGFTVPKLALSPLHLLYLLSPLAFIQTTLLAHFTGELDRVRVHFLRGSASGGAGIDRTWLLLNGVMAFFLNVVSFNANRRVGPLGMSVAANCKQVLTILFAVVIFDLTITATNGIGIGLTLIGGALYAAVELRERAVRDAKSRLG